MLNVFARPSLSRVTDPVGARLVKLGITPNAMTVIGTAVSLGAALWFIPHNRLFIGSLLVAIFLCFDLLDGAMARAAEKTSPLGAVLDASCDRLVDAALFASIAWWALVTVHKPFAGAAALACGALAQLISYIKARADASGLSAEGGLVERAERLIIALIGTAIHGLGVPYSVDVALGVLLAASLVTVGQRVIAVYRSAREAG
jgi:CDP-diacylglycerol--glycerol-3-phosphate 3-phosphatidyltransferase